MDVLLLCGYFENKYQQEIGAKTKTWVENAANTFQQRLIKGLKSQNVNLTIVSAPLIGPWPMVYQDFVFRGFSAGESDEGVTYVGFNNLWGYRNISRAASLKKQVRAFLKSSRAEKKAVIVYCVHAPYMEAAAYAKALDPSVQIHMVVPDLPQYMNLSKKPHPVYDFFKRIDIRKIYQLNRHVDSYMLLTRYMAEKMEVGNRPYIVVEAIADEVPERLGNGHLPGKTIVYAGKLMENFGVKRLLEAFSMMDDPDARLQICGGGELRPYIEERAREDHRIVYHGQVSAEKAHEILMNADVLVNPRLNDEEYTKYSFPSKNMEYLMTGNAVVAYMLDGMPDAYREFLTIPADNSAEAFAAALQEALRKAEGRNEARHQSLIDYCKTNCDACNVAGRIIGLLDKGER